jgi:hypothetical protein
MPQRVLLMFYKVCQRPEILSKLLSIFSEEKVYLSVDFHWSSHLQTLLKVSIPEI